MGGKKGAAKRRTAISSSQKKACAARFTPEHHRAGGSARAIGLSAKTDVRCFRRKTSADLSDELMRLLQRAAE